MFFISLRQFILVLILLSTYPVCLSMQRPEKFLYQRLPCTFEPDPEDFRIFWVIPVMKAEDEREQDTAQAILQFIGCCHLFCMNIQEKTPCTTNGIIVEILNGKINRIITPKGSTRIEPAPTVWGEFTHALVAYLGGQRRHISETTEHIILRRDIYQSSLRHAVLRVPPLRDHYQ